MFNHIHSFTHMKDIKTFTDNLAECKFYSDEFIGLMGYNQWFLYMFNINLQLNLIQSFVQQIDI